MTIIFFRHHVALHTEILEESLNDPRYDVDHIYHKLIRVNISMNDKGCHSILCTLSQCAQDILIYEEYEMRELNKVETKEVAGAQYNGYWGNNSWDNNAHSNWANQWHQAGMDAWNNRQPGRGYPYQGYNYW